MPIERRQWNEAARWLPYAEGDLRAAETLMSAPVPMIYAAAFHCQQAAEKMTKALPILYGGAVPKIHDLVELTVRLRELDADAGKGR